MAGDTLVTVVGTLTADPELRYTQSGVAVANMTIASNPRVFDKQKNEWVDGDALFLRSTVWREHAEHVASSLSKGSRVIAQGRLVQKSFTDKEQNKRTSIELEIEDIGPALRWATATVEKSGKGGGGQRQQSDTGGFGGQQGAQAGAWATPGQGGFGGNDSDVPS